MKSILVTGAGGYVGSTLSSMLLDAGYHVIGFDRYFFGTNSLQDLFEHPNFKAVQKDIREIQRADLENVYGVCDLAALSNDPSGDLNPDLTNSINHAGRVRVATLAKEVGVERYI